MDPPAQRRSRTTTGISRSVLVWYSSYGGHCTAASRQSRSRSSPEAVRAVAGKRSPSTSSSTCGSATQVPVPAGMRVRAAVGGDDDVRRPGALVDQRNRARLARRPPACRQQQDLRATTPDVADLAVGLAVDADVRVAEQALGVGHRGAPTRRYNAAPPTAIPARCRRGRGARMSLERGVVSLSPAWNTRPRFRVEAAELCGSPTPTKSRAGHGDGGVAWDSSATGSSSPSSG